MQENDSATLISSGDLIAKACNGTNLVDNKQTWQLAETAKNDLEAMKKCCEAEISKMKNTGLPPAPFYFKRFAILSRKAKEYEQEVFCCELYIDLVDKLYASTSNKDMADVRKGPGYQGLVKRLPKAKELLAKDHALK